MRNRIIGIFILLCTIQNHCFSKDNEFESFFLANFAKFKTPFSIHDHLARYFGKNYSESEYLLIDKDLFLSKYLKENGNKQIDKSVFIKSKIFPLFYFEKNDYVILCYDKIQTDRYGASEYQCWLKSFTRMGESKDSIQIAHFADYEGITVRAFSQIIDFQKVSLKYLERDAELDNNNVVKTKSFKVEMSFQVKDSGFFQVINENDNSFVFKTDYGYYSLEEVFTEFHNKCVDAKSFLRGDFNGDKNIDLIYLIYDHCKGRYSDLIFSSGNYQGLFSYGGTLGGINLDSKFYDLSLISIEKEILSIELNKIGQQKKIRLSYSFNNKKRLCSLKFVEVLNSNFNRRFAPENPNTYLSQSIQLAKAILDEP